MESIKIEKDGSVSIPYPGNMKITVEMTEGLFEEFLQFRKSKDEYDNRASKEIEGLRRRMEFLAKAVINSVEGEALKHYGDITKINGSLVEPVNVVIGGSPCQDLSVAGKQAGLE